LQVQQRNNVDQLCQHDHVQRSEHIHVWVQLVGISWYKGVVSLITGWNHEKGLPLHSHAHPVLGAT
jgi:hypothetical protein